MRLRIEIVPNDESEDKASFFQSGPAQELELRAPGDGSQRIIQLDESLQQDVTDCLRTLGSIIRRADARLRMRGIE